MEQQQGPSRGPQEPQGRPSEHACPECGAPREADNTPSCACGPRAADALRDARTAQAAAAEDFDPLRIRPYVELNGTGEPTVPEPEPDATMTLRAVGAGPSDASPAAGATSAPSAASAGAPSDHDLRLFDASAADDPASTAPLEPVPDGTGDRPPRGRRRGVLIGAAAAVVAVVGTAGYASGLFSYESPSRDGALPDEVRASVPVPSATASSTAPRPSASSAEPVATSASASPSASASASASESPSPSPSPSASSASPTPSRSPEPTTVTPSAPAFAPDDDGEDGDRDGGGTLHRGDRGAEVTELQQRLAQLYLYTGADDGTYDREVEDSVRTYQWSRGIRSDELGVYGEATRRMLESETHRP
ncbi:peptidoglycan-binding protein [Streptomyces sp. JHA26]|uniref:peptidoglycan-binding domain-containing protein n=1 Tax=Streptomyces sp. JHA26 TaxID=1917143 RepID=UPI00209B408A|nr:peptidoglycan-binding domain-containing protein [Streptomyces sp. JHA26]